MGVYQLEQESGEELQNDLAPEEVAAVSAGEEAGQLVEMRSLLSRWNQNEVVEVVDPMGLESYVLHPEFLHRWQHYPPAGHKWVSN